LKAAVVEDLTVLVDPPGAAEDRVHFNTTANTIVVRTGKDSMSQSAGLQVFVPDPIERLRDEHGPFFCPPYGQGVLLTCNDCEAVATLDKRFKFAFERAHDATAEQPLSRPLAVELDAEQHTLEVAKTGLRPYVADVLVKTGEF